MGCSSLFGVAAALVLTFVLPVSAQQYSADKPLGVAAQSAPAFLKNAGIDQNLGRLLPLSDHFLDSSGTDVPLGAYFEHRPVVLALVYYRCRMLCPQVLSGMARSLRQVAFTPGKEYDVLVASIDPADTPADGVAEKVRFLDTLGNPGAASLDDAPQLLRRRSASVRHRPAPPCAYFARILGRRV